MMVLKVTTLSGKEITVPVYSYVKVDNYTYEIETESKVGSRINRRWRRLTSVKDVIFPFGFRDTSKMTATVAA